MPKSPIARALLGLVLLVAARPAHAFNALTSPDGVHVLAVGDSGAVWRSWNAGDFWSSTTLGMANLEDVDMRGFVVLAAGSDGAVWRSGDSGGNWQAIATPAVVLHGVSWADDSTAFAAGSGGIVLASRDSGATWQASYPTSTDLLAIHFTDALHGWVVGESLTVLRTVDGGVTWTPFGLSGADDLVDVHATAVEMWTVGRLGSVLRSTDGTTLETVTAPVPEFVGFHAVHVTGADSAVVTGGGGFVRRTIDGGQSWQYAMQPAFTALSDVHFVDGWRGWACAAQGRFVTYTIDGGLTWLWNASTQDLSAWVQTEPADGANIRGDTFAPNRQGGPNSIYCAIGDTFFRSTDFGGTWSPFRTLPGVTKINALFVSPKDSLTMVAAVDAPDRVIRSTDGGANWTPVLTRDFSEYGTPVEMNPDRPDTLFFAPEDGKLYRSADFGATWDTLANVPFRSPCDIVIAPGNDANMWVGDGITGMGLGQIFQSTDGGLTWDLRFTSGSGSEIPSMDVATLETDVGFGTQWSTGGVARTLDGGETWEVITNTSTAWGGTCAPDDPMVYMFGVFAGAGTYITAAQGVPFRRYPIQSSNYAIHARDRGNLLAMQLFGAYKFMTHYDMPAVQSQILTLSAPDGGALWEAGTPQRIRWTSFGVLQAAVEWQPDPGSPWELIAMVPGYLDELEWTPPLVPTTEARVRVREAWNDDPIATSGTFSILAPGFSIMPAPLDLGETNPGSMLSGVITLQNTGTGTLDVLDIAVDRPDFWTGRTSLSIPPSSSDTVGVHYLPVVAGRDTANVSFITNAAEGPIRLRVFGNSLPPKIVLQQNTPNPFKGVTVIRYSLPAAANVELDVFNLQGQRVATLAKGRQPAGNYTVAFGPTAPGGDHRKLPAGVYFYRFRTDAVELRRKMILLE